MASRQAAGARPGARFAQFKLVLLGPSSPEDESDPTANRISGESAVGKVGSSCV